MCCQHAGWLDQSEDWDLAGDKGIEGQPIRSLVQEYFVYPRGSCHNAGMAWICLETRAFGAANQLRACRRQGALGRYKSSTCWVGVEKTWAIEL